jgi:hypothetical protein
MDTLQTRHSECTTQWPRSVGPPPVAASEMFQGMEVSCIYIKQAFRYSQQGWFSSLLGFSMGLITANHKRSVSYELVYGFLDHLLYI